MAVNSKAKGNKFEREISEGLSLWLTEGKEKRAVWRSDSSGASATNWAKRAMEQRYVSSNAGDIRKITEKGLYPAVDDFFDNYCVELKHYKAVDFYPPLSKVTLSLFKSAYADRAISGKKVVLIIKANNRKILWFSEDTIPDKVCHIVVPYNDIEFKGYLYDEIISTPYDNGQCRASDSINTKRKDSGL